MVRAQKKKQGELFGRRKFERPPVEISTNQEDLFAREWMMEIPIRVDSHNNKRQHHFVAAKIKKAERMAVWAAWIAADKFVPVYPVKVCFTRIGPGKMDDDNIPDACKYLRDELCRCWGLVRGDGEPKFNKKTGKPILPQAKDDGDEVAWSYGQEKGPRGHYAVRVIVEEICSTPST